MTKEVRQLGLIGIVIVLIVGIIGGVAWYKQQNAPTPTQAQVRDNSYVSGAKDAAVTLVEFGDYQCPACGQAEPIIEQIRKDYADKSFRFVFRNYPLSMHPNAQPAAQAAEAAGAQGKFWEMHDALYSNQNAWANLSDPTSQFEQYAKQVGVADMNKFKNELASHAYAAKIQADQKDGDTLGVSATPTFFLNGKKMEGVQDYNALKQQIDELLAKADVSQASSSAQASDSAEAE
jgi:protein-disulfide isomerase